MKKFLALLLALVMVFALVACGGGNGDVEPSTQPSDNANLDNTDKITDDEATKSDYVRPSITLETKDSNVNPLAMRSSGVISYSVYEMLYTSENGIGSKMVPWLADATKGGNNELGLKGMDHEVGSGVYVFYIYDYIKDSAGNTITAEDVVYSFEQTLAFGQASGWNKIEKFVADGPTTFKMICKEDFSTKGEIENILLRCFIFSKKGFEASPSQFTADACGTGRYAITEFTQDASVTLTKRADYWQTNEELIPRAAWANVEKINLIVSSDNNSNVMALQSGNLDMLASIPLGLAAGLDESKFAVYTYPQNGLTYLEPNCSADSIMGNKDLRLAVFYALNNANICKVLNAASKAPVDTYYPLTAFGHDLFADYNKAWDSLENYVTQTDEAKVEQYKKAAGYNNEVIRILHNDNTGAVEQILTVLDAAGFKVEGMQRDRNASQAVYADSKGWDLFFNQTNSSDYMTNLYDHAFNNKQGHGVTKNFIDDAKLNELMQKAYAVGAGEAEMDALWQYIVDMAYEYPIMRNLNGFVLPAGAVDSVWRNDKNTFMPGAANWVEG